MSGSINQISAYDRWISCGLSARTATALCNEGVTTKEQLSAYDRSRIMWMPNFGLKGLRELERLMGWPPSPTPNGTRQIVTRLTDKELIEEMERRGFVVSK